MAGVILALAVVAGGCAGSSTDAPPAPAATETVRPGGRAVFAAETEPTAGFNNRTAKGNTTGLRNVMRRVWPSPWITTPDFRTVLDTNLVLSVEEPTAARPTTIVYRLNPTAKWSDGVPISADDFIYNWEVEKPGALDIDGKPISWVAPGEETIQNVNGSPDGKTVTVTLAQPFAEWRSLFAKPLVPAHIGKRVGWNTGFDRFDPAVVIAGGPYRIESYNPGRDLTLVRNEQYWGSPANLDSVIFRFGASGPVAVDALRNGEVDVIAPRSQVDILGQLRSVPDVTTLVGTGFEAEHLDLNLRNPLLAMPEVRQAFALALDRQAIVNRTAGQIDKGATVMQHRLLSAGDPNHPRETTGASRYSKPDVAAARALLEGAGFRPEPDGIYAKDGKRLSLRITSTTGDALRENQTELIQSQVRLAGIEITPDNIAPGALTGRITQRDFDIISLLQGMPAFPTTTSASFGKDGSVNISSYASTAVDDLYKAAKSELDDRRRADLLNQIDEQLWKDLPRIPLYQRPAIVAFRNTLANVGINPVSGPVWNIEQWGLKASPRS